MSNSYIVVFKPESDGEHASTSAINDLAGKVEGSGGSIKHRYDSKVMRGFAGSFSEELKAELEQVRLASRVRVLGLLSSLGKRAGADDVHSDSTLESSTLVRLAPSSSYRVLEGISLGGRHAVSQRRPVRSRGDSGQTEHGEL